MGGFYKYDNGLLFCDTVVENLNYKLYIEGKDYYTYPVDGWYYFDNETLAKAFLIVGINPEVIINKPGFYKNDNGLLFGEIIESLDYDLYIENKDDYTYPIDGWYYFENETLAKEFLGITE